MLDSRQRTKIKNDKVRLWHMEFASFSYIMQYRPDQRNVAPDTFVRTYCSATTVAFLTSCILQDIHDRLYHPGVTRILHFIGSKNLPHSTIDVKRIVSACKICACIKHLFVWRDQGTLIKAMQSMERISIKLKVWYHHLLSKYIHLLQSMNALAFRLHFRVKIWLLPQ